MHVFKKFESFGHSSKRQATNIFTIDNEIHKWWIKFGLNFVKIFKMFKHCLVQIV